MEPKHILMGFIDNTNKLKTNLNFQREQKVTPYALIVFDILERNFLM